MRLLLIMFGLVLLLGALLDAFETIVLPRRVQRGFRLTTWFYRRTWRPWRWLASHINGNTRRENFLGYFGPFSLLMLLGLWAACLIFGFALLQAGFGTHVQLANEKVSFATLLYLSGETFFTLGLGDVLPTASPARILTVLEGGMGFAFLGVVIGYIPTIYSAFSKREIEISLLDARAGSPPTAAELLLRLGGCPEQKVLDQIFRDWERWAAEALEAHISYPALSFFRSQHSNQSWLGALTVMLDSTALIISGIDGTRNEQAKITFATARHVAVDLAQVVNAVYAPNDGPGRLPPQELVRLIDALALKGLKLNQSPEAANKLIHLRSLYEPYVNAIARNLFITLPPWIHPQKRKDNWQAGPWDRKIQAGNPESGRPEGEGAIPTDEHF
jgi:hypothetical protein